MINRFELFCCPVCGKPLVLENRSLLCPNMHRFDVAKEGYVNLLISNRTNSGDGADMIMARHNFLESGYYSKFRDALCTLMLDIFEALNHGTGENKAFLDAGCGEGYFTTAIFNALFSSGMGPKAAGIDISKPAVRIAAKNSGKKIAFAVAGSSHIPVKDESIGILLSNFAPVCGKEFYRVLCPGGFLIISEPGVRHLYGLKEILYPHPYENRANRYNLEGFEHLRLFSVKDELVIRNQRDIRDLFLMTPYCYKTPEEGIQELMKTETLKTTAEFNIHIFCRRWDS